MDGGVKTAISVFSGPVYATYEFVLVKLIVPGMSSEAANCKADADN